MSLGLVDGAGRDEELGELRDRRGVEAAERRRVGLQHLQVGFSGDREARERGARVDRARVDVLQDRGEARRVRLCVRDLPRQKLEKIALPQLGIAGLELVVVIGHAPSDR